MQHRLKSPLNSTLGISLSIFTYLAASCNPVTPVVTAEQIRVQYSFAAQPWLASLNKCASKVIVSTEQRAAVYQDLQIADLLIRVGQPENLNTPSYQIGTDHLVVIVNSQNTVTALTSDQVNGIFAGRIKSWLAVGGTDTPIQVWVFTAGEDVQQVFDQTVLSTRPVTSQARLANSPDEMSQAIIKDANAIGLITGRLRKANTTEVFSDSRSMPVLVITQSKPQGAMAQILVCLQK